MQTEIEAFIQAQNTICDKAKINTNIFMRTSEEIPNDKQSILDLINASLTSPFKSQRAFTKAKAIEIFKNASNLAINKISEPALIKLVSDKDEALIIFDILLTDYAFLHEGISSEEFKATITKNDLTREPSLQG